MRHSQLEYSQKHPVILPDCHFVRIYLQQLHKDNLHAGPTLLLATARQKVWILQGKNAARQVVRKCVTCTRWKGSIMGQKMGDLPEARVHGKKAFDQVGVDYAGPITIKTRNGRKVPTTKGYICVFVCMATRAVHLEAVSDLTSEAFIAALRRFVSRRGKPAVILSDNGTNFVGAERELKKLLQQENLQRKIEEMAAKEGITWRFNPAGAPHMGGMWESCVKSTKYHLRRVMSEAMLSYEELSTVLCQIEACLNSRPLGPLPEDPTSLEPLTPGYLLIGCSLNQVADPSVLEIKENRLSRWQYCQKLHQSFWQRWQDEYLTTLQARNKWRSDQPDAYVGQVVIVREENTPPSSWKIARVTAVHPGKDGKVRVVTLQTSTGEFQRPIAKIVPLLADNEQN